MSERDKGSNDLIRRTGLDPHDVAAPRAEITHHVSQVLVRDDDFDLHDGLEKHWLGLLGGVLERERAGDLEGHLARVHRVVRAVVDDSPDAHHWIPRDDAGLCGLANPCLDGRNELLRDGPADYLVHELEAPIRAERLQANPAVPVLAPAAGLPDEASLGRSGGADSLPVGDLGLADVRLNPELPEEAIHDHLQVQLAHARDDRLPGLGVSSDAEGRILFSQTGQSDPHFILIGLGLGFNSLGDNRLWEANGLQEDRMVRVAQGIAGEGVLESDDRADVARADMIDLLALVRVHAQETADALALPFRGVLHV